jgi:hypothetical protein
LDVPGICDSIDCLVGLLIAALDTHLTRRVPAIAAHLPEISSESAESRMLRINLKSPDHSFISRTAAKPIP